MRWLTAVVLRGAALAGLWAFLAGWSAEYGIYGVVSVATATGFSLWLSPPQRQVDVRRWPRRVWFTVALALWFIGQSVIGGVDVAVRAVRRPVGIDPAVVTAPVELPPGHSRQLAMLMMNLMPGSMIQRGVHQTDDDVAATALTWSDGHSDQAAQVELHTLSASLNPAAQWRSLQQRVHRALD